MLCGFLAGLFCASDSFKGKLKEKKIKGFSLPITLPGGGLSGRVPNVAEPNHKPKPAAGGSAGGGGCCQGRGAGDERGYQEELRLCRAQKSAPGGQRPQKVEGADLTPCTPTPWHPPRAPHRALGVPVPPRGAAGALPRGSGPLFFPRARNWARSRVWKRPRRERGRSQKCSLGHSEKMQSPQHPRVPPGEQPQGEESSGKIKV